ncbi:MAG: hypothetical protein OES79_13010 [Planctomycetota bacterium]|nr:hypothetical protein [Planctomycetota bacterium]
MDVGSSTNLPRVADRLHDDLVRWMTSAATNSAILPTVKRK